MKRLQSVTLILSLCFSPLYAKNDHIYSDLAPLAYEHKPSLYEPLPVDYQELAADFAYLQIFSLSFLTGLWLLPNPITNWNQKQILEKGLGQSWVDHIRAGPVMDKDPWAINYIGHSLSGAYFYTIARNRGLSVVESALFNLMLSTFYWEYGVEAFFEIPSIQDLYVTPIFGSLLGEGFYQLRLLIEENEGEILGSKRLGKVAMVFLNPEGALAKLFRDYFKERKEIISFKFIARFQSPLEVDDAIRQSIPGLDVKIIESFIGFYVIIKY